MAELWTKKKKILTRKERFKITDNPSKAKFRDETAEKHLSDKQEYQQSQCEDELKYSAAQRDQKVRLLALRASCDRFRRLRATMIDLEINSRNAETRRQYPEIRNLSRFVPWVNELVSKWREEYESAPRKRELKTEIDDCIRILNTLTVYIENPLDVRHVANWYECKRSVRDELYDKLDRVSYSVLTNIEKEMTYLNMDIMYWKKSHPVFTHALWTVLEKPKSGKDEKFPLRCNFDECGVAVHLTKAFAYKSVAVRCLVILNDYFSTDCRTSRAVDLPESWQLDFLEYSRRTWERKEARWKQLDEENSALRMEQEKRDNILSKIKYLLPNADSSMAACPTNTDSEPSGTRAIDLNSLSQRISHRKSLTQLALDEEKQEIEDIKQHYKVELSKFECNMRKYHIVGGVYHLELLVQPPQPKMLKDGAVLRMIIGADSLKRWPYSETYEPPTVKTGPVKQSTDDDDEDAESTPEGALLAKLILVVIKLPDDVLWFDAPVPVHWDYDKCYWSTERIYEVKFNEEKQTLSFRAGQMTAFGLAVVKFNNLPFQSWELRPSNDSSEVVFSLITAILALEFQIRRNEVCLTMLENANTSALQQLVGVAYEPRTLVRLLKTGGVDIFPAADAGLYVEGVPVKHRVTEDHLYHCMATLCSHYRFSWSRWNLMAGYRKFVMQIRGPNVVKGNALLLVSDQRAMITESADVNQAFAEDGGRMDGAFYPDLMSWAEGNGGEELKNSIEGMDVIFIQTIYYMLSETRVLSLS